MCGSHCVYVRRLSKGKSEKNKQVWQRESDVDWLDGSGLVLSVTLW